MLKLIPKPITEYHKALLTSEWVDLVTSQVEERLRVIPDLTTCSGTGWIVGKANEERYMGPNSLVKQEFHVLVNVERSDQYRPGFDAEAFVAAYPGNDYALLLEEDSLDHERRKKPTRKKRTDTYEACFNYQPLTNTFTLVEEIVQTVLRKTRCERVNHELAFLKQRVNKDLTINEFHALRCPLCGSSIAVIFSQNGSRMDMNCNNGNCMMKMHDIVDSLPTWWKEFRKP